MSSIAPLIDTHCHIHDTKYDYDVERVLQGAKSAGVTNLLCVGTDAASSREAIAAAQRFPIVHASVGIHPHVAQSEQSSFSVIRQLANDATVVAIGECGLDYYYEHSPRVDQQALLQQHLELAHATDLPGIFHIRGSRMRFEDAFEDFWRVYDKYRVPGVVHSFTGDATLLAQILERDLYVGINGILTFSGDPEHARMVRALPLEKLLLETDAPYLTPEPIRGTINEPKYIEYILEWVSKQRSEPISVVASATTENAKKLFQIS